MMIAIGIDLGTTNSCVASYTATGVEVIANHSGQRTTPSYVLLTDEEMSIGKSAKEASAKNSPNLLYDAKRMIGKLASDKDLQSDITSLKWPFTVKSDNNDQPVVEITNLKTKKKTYSPEEISCFVLTEMKKIAEELHLGHGKKLTDAVITVPAYFNDNQRRATEKAANMAGLNVLRLLNEPSAAGLAFCYQRSKEKRLTEKKTFLVFDLGGGTFDVSIMEIQNNEVEIKVVAGDTHLGGNDFDARLVDFFVKKFEDATNEDATKNKKSLWKLRDAAIKAKEHLSLHNHYEVSIDSLLNEEDFEYDIKREEFEKTCQDLFDKTLTIVDTALNDAKLSPSDINEVLLVGGSSRIPKIQEMLTKKFGKEKINKCINGDEAVAYGAAVQAAMLKGKMKKESTMVLNDVTPLSIGNDTKACDCNFNCDCGGIMEVMIPRNTKIPTEKTSRFETGFDNQTSVCLSILEGEHSESEKNHVLGTLHVTCIPPDKAGVEKLDVTFEINANGMLNATAIIVSTGKSATVTIDYGSHRLDPSAVQQMLKDAVI